MSISSKSLGPRAVTAHSVPLTQGNPPRAPRPAALSRMSQKATPAARPSARPLVGLPQPQPPRRGGAVQAAAVPPRTGSISDAAETYAVECEAQLQAVAASLRGLQALRGPQTVGSALEPYNDFAMLLDRAFNRAALMQQVHPDPMVRLQASEQEQRLAALSTELELSRAVYDALASVDTSGEDARTQRYVQRLLARFRSAGVDRDSETRAQVRALNQKLMQLGQAFSGNIVGDERSLQVPAAALDGLPEDYIAAHPADAQGMVRAWSEN